MEFAGAPAQTAESGRWQVWLTTTHHSFGGPFSAGSKPIFASKYAFCSLFQNLQENHLLASKFRTFLPKIAKSIAMFLQKFAKFAREKMIFL